MTSPAPIAASTTALRRLAVRASLFEMGGFGLAQVIRLGSNLVLSRLLFPDAFGLAALVSIFIQGLELLSDVGIQQSVIQNERGDDPLFLDTAWWLQVARGGCLAIAACLLAFPVSRIYGEPLLFPLLLTSALPVLFGGLQSTAIFSMRRRIEVGWLTALEIFTQVVNVAVMLLWAWLHPTVWALIAGGVVASFVRMVASHLLPNHHRNRFRWDPASAREILRFGRWIFGSSAVFFFGRHGDRLLLGRLLGVGPLGVYSIAVMLSETIGVVIERVIVGVFYPIFSRVRSQGTAALGDIYYRTRLRVDLLALPALGGLAILGDLVVAMLWDERYHDAGWMLRILSVRVAVACVATPCESCLSAIGQPRFGFRRSVARTVWILSVVPLGWACGGMEGMIWATALSEVPSLIILLPAFRDAGLLRPLRELLALVTFAAGALAALGLRTALGG